MSYLLLPFVVLPCYAAIKNLDPTLFTAAKNLGASTIQTFLRIEMPLCLPFVATGGLLVFVLALGYFVVPTLLGSGSETMISMIIAKQINVLFDWRLGASLSVLLLLAVVLLLIAGMVFINLWSQRQKIWRIIRVK
jgi:ABC-type spermidine/putrescine transport system permease subunit I